jgi:type I restriction enzyme, R subunit
MNQLPETKELYSSQIPALKTLMVLGWSFVSKNDCLNKRGSTRELILKDELIEYLKQHRFEYRGEQYPLSANAIDTIVRDLSTPGLNEGLMKANERIYNKLLLGITVAEFINGKKHSPTIPIIDWNNIRNNRFQVTEEMDVSNTDGTSTRRPDIVCYVNGLPLVVIEAKRPESGNPNTNMVDEGISQNIRNQKPDEIPSLFAYAQLLFAISNIDGRYGTTKTIKKFWSQWKEETGSEDAFDEAHFQDIKDQRLTKEQANTLLSSQELRVKRYFEKIWQDKQLATEQDCLLISLLISLLTPERFLDFLRFNILFDNRVGKIAARYPQAFSTKALLKRINQRKAHGGREGGVIWHTTGSGKSFTMVFLCKALLLHPSLKDCRIIVVTDRTQLEKQLSNTFSATGVFGSDISSKKDSNKAKVKSGRDLAKRIGHGDERIIFSIINKFNSASQYNECYNPSENLIVLIDEGHRSQSGENHERMRKALPNAAYIAFTGTPLLKDDKTTNKFGPILHAYTMQRAEEDGSVTPLLYEERQPDLSVNSKAIDNWFDRITASLSEKQANDLKKKFSNKNAIYSSENRIELISWDIATHFNDNIKSLKTGLKGQLATENKTAAIRYKKYLDATELVSSAVIISPPDTREGHEDVDEKELPLVQQWWKDNVGNDAEEYERNMLEAFADNGAPDILIVVDKLLTGFDEPRNTVLYIDKPLKEHNLIQAIARVNRLHEQKDYGLLIDYRGILEELDTSIKKYQDLASLTQGGYDIEDIEGLYEQVSSEYKKLPMLHDSLWDIFSSVENTSDQEQFRRVLIPEYAEDEDGNTFDKKQKVRDDFYKALTEFGLCLKIALSSHGFFEDSQFSEERILSYKRDLKFFIEVRATAKRDAQETIDYSAYEKQISRLVDKHVVGNTIREPDGVYVVAELGKEKPEEWSVEKTRNETDIIRTRVKKTIEQELASDPYAQKVFSKLLEEAIAEAEAMFDHPLKQYALLKKFESDLETMRLDLIPVKLHENAHAKAYYGIFIDTLGEHLFEIATKNEILEFIEQASFIEKIVDHAVSEYSLNSQNIEAEISNNLLPVLFKAHGMDKAKEIIERVIHITRIGISRNKEKHD